MSLTTSLGYIRGQHSIAQSFNVDASAGIYLTKIGLYFHSRDEDATNPMPVHLDLRPMVNGYPSSSKVLPGTRVTVSQSNITTSTDATVETEFRFTEPVYLSGNTDYCFVLSTSSNAYRHYMSEVGDFTVGSTEKKILKQTTLGSLFYSQNSVTYTAAQELDLSFKLYKAKFKTNTGTIKLKNAEIPKKLLTSNPFTTDSGSSTVTVYHPHHGLRGNENVRFDVDSSISVGGISGVNIMGTRTVTSMDATGYKFTAGASATSSTIGGGDSVLGTQNLIYSRVYPNIEFIQPTGTTIIPSYKGVTARSIAGAETPYVKSSTFSAIGLNTNNDAYVNRAVCDPFLETNQIAGGDSNARKSGEMEIQLITTT